MVVGLIAGGEGAFIKAVEGAEDSVQLGEDDLRAINVSERDVVIVDPSFAADDPPLERFTRSLGARLVVENVRMRDGSPRHDPHRLAAVYAGLMQQ